jgi:hypothetical protein
MPAPRAFRVHLVELFRQRVALVAETGELRHPLAHLECLADQLNRL